MNVSSWRYKKQWSLAEEASFEKQHGALGHQKKKINDAFSCFY